MERNLAGTLGKYISEWELELHCFRCFLQRRIKSSVSYGLGEEDTRIIFTGTKIAQLMCSHQRFIRFIWCLRRAQKCKIPG